MLGENPGTEDGAPIRRPGRQEEAQRAFPLRANARAKERRANERRIGFSN
jgi:hypothetical protein